MVPLLLGLKMSPWDPGDLQGYIIEGETEAVDGPRSHYKVSAPGLESVLLILVFLPLPLLIKLF